MGREFLGDIQVFFFRKLKGIDTIDESYVKTAERCKPPDFM